MDVDDDGYEAALRASVRRRRQILIGVGLAVACFLGVVIVRAAIEAAASKDDWRADPIALTPAQQQELAEAIAASRQRIATLDAPWRAAVAAIDPRTVRDGARCTALDRAASGLRENPQSSGWSGWDTRSPLPFNGGSSGSLTRTPFALRFIAARDPLPAMSPAAAGLTADLDHLANPGWTTATFEQRMRRATSGKLRSADVLVRLDRVVEPRREGRESFHPGELEASAWVFDHDTNQVVCAGVVVVRSSPSVYLGTSNLNDDLVINLVRALPSGLIAR